ncbi:MAG: cytochrome C oxidase subunit III, partial [Fidelibacterota bacterium]
MNPINLSTENYQVAKVKDELFDHDFDGIQEFDNDLPGWWKALFYISIVVA